jgi:hypothetical protein
MTKSQTTRLLLVCGLLASRPAITADDPLTPLAFLAGHCWAATFNDGRETDTHCYEWMHDGMQLRDRHVVHNDQPEYRGETIYAWNGERKRIEYRYWNSIGGLSDGYVESKPDGTLHFLDDRYVGLDGIVYTFASEMSQPDAAQYLIVSRYLEGEEWREMWTRTFDRSQAR